MNYLINFSSGKAYEEMLNWSLFLMPMLAFNELQIQHQLINILGNMFQSQQYNTLIVIDEDPQKNKIPQMDINYDNTSFAKMELIPKLFLTQNSKLQNFNTTWNSKILILYIIPPQFTLRNDKILKQIIKFQTKTLNIKIMCLMLSTPIVGKEILIQYFVNFRTLHLYDVLIVPVKTQNINIYYTYKVRPNFKILTKEFNSIQTTQYFIKQIDNFHQNLLHPQPHAQQDRFYVPYSS